MSEENVEIVRRVYTYVSANRETPRELTGPGYEVDATDVAVEFTVAGFEVAEAALREYWNTFERFSVELKELIHADNGCVVTAVRDGGRMKGSGAEAWSHYFHVWTFRDGKIVQLSIHTDRARALEAAGLRDSSG